MQWPVQVVNVVIYVNVTLGTVPVALYLLLWECPADHNQTMATDM